MLNRAIVYDILYALAARDGRQELLFGDCAPLAHDAFERSLVGDGFPELWFEMPLLGDPWFDFHALASREELAGCSSFPASRTGGYPEVFEWFAAQGPLARQLALSYDVSSGSVDMPAIQLLTRGWDVPMVCDFLKTAGRADVIDGYRAFIERIPNGWFACYTGVFPARLGDRFRIECIPTPELQRQYAESPDRLEADLRRAGFTAFDETLVPRCRLMARTPFCLEFQFDVFPDGTVGDTLGASVRFASPGDDEAKSGTWQTFESAAAGEFMGQVEAWGLADERWRLLGDVAFAKRVSRGEASLVVYIYPAFIKLRWRGGAPLDAKTYIIAGVES